MKYASLEAQWTILPLKCSNLKANFPSSGFCNDAGRNVRIPREGCKPRGTTFVPDEMCVLSMTSKHHEPGVLTCNLKAAHKMAKWRDGSAYCR